MTASPDAAEADRAPADPAPAATGARAAARRRAPWWLVAVLGVLAVLGVVASLLLLTRPTQDELRDSAVAAAERYTQSLTTYDARTLDDDVQRFTDVATAEFASEYERTITELRATIDSGQVVSVGTVVGAGVERVEDDTAVVLVAVDQQITTGGQTRTEANRVRMTLERTDGRWLVGGVERL